MVEKGTYKDDHIRWLARKGLLRKDRLDGLDLSSSALIILDMQRYFLDRSSHAYIPQAEDMLPRLIRVVKNFAEKGPVVLTRHQNTPHDAGMLGEWWADVIEKDSSLSRLAEPFESLESLSSEKFSGRNVVVLPKTQYDAFYRTPLEKMLREKGIRSVIIGGVMTHLCCETTARSAFVRGFRVFFLTDGTATYGEEFHRASLLTLSHGFAAPLTLEELSWKLKEGEKEQ